MHWGPGHRAAVVTRAAQSGHVLRLGYRCAAAARAPATSGWCCRSAPPGAGPAVRTCGDVPAGRAAADQRAQRRRGASALRAPALTAVITLGHLSPRSSARPAARGDAAVGPGHGAAAGRFGYRLSQQVSSGYLHAGIPERPGPAGRSPPGSPRASSTWSPAEPGRDLRLDIRPIGPLIATSRRTSNGEVSHEQTQSSAGGAMIETTAGILSVQRGGRGRAGHPGGPARPGHGVTRPVQAGGGRSASSASRCRCPGRASWWPPPAARTSTRSPSGRSAASCTRTCRPPRCGPMTTVPAWPARRARSAWCWPRRAGSRSTSASPTTCRRRTRPGSRWIPG